MNPIPLTFLDTLGDIEKSDTVTEAFLKTCRTFERCMQARSYLESEEVGDLLTTNDLPEIHETILALADKHDKKAGQLQDKANDFRNTHGLNPDVNDDETIKECISHEAKQAWNAMIIQKQSINEEIHHDPLIDDEGDDDPFYVLAEQDEYQSFDMPSFEKENVENPQTFDVTYIEHFMRAIAEKMNKKNKRAMDKQQQENTFSLHRDKRQKK